MITTPSTTSLAYKESLGFFDDLTDEDWKVRQARNRQHYEGDDPLQYWNTKTPANTFYFYHYEPLFSCPHLHRVAGVPETDRNGPAIRIV